MIPPRFGGEIINLVPLSIPKLENIQKKKYFPSSSRMRGPMDSSNIHYRWIPISMGMTQL